jgi:hypothetical protein
MVKKDNMILDKLLNVTPNEIEKEIVVQGLDALTGNKNMIHDINCRPGVEHYKLLCYISTLYENQTLIELGTWIGAGAISLGYNAKNYVITYDIAPYLDLKMLPDNIELRYGDYKRTKDMLNSPFLFIDVTHDGSLEMEIYNFLSINGYKGITMWDDIHLNNDMKMFWDSARHKKYDLTHLGHTTGTGLMVFE